MIRYLFQKSVILLISLFVISSTAFFLMKMIPGDPFSEEQSLREEAQQALMQQHGLDLPLYVQYGNYLNKLVHGDLGFSLKYSGQKVNQMIREGFTVSAWLGAQAFVIAVIGGVFLGAFSALKTSPWSNRSMILFSTIGISIPSFILAALLQYIFAFELSLFPIARWGTWSQTVLPSIALAATPLAFLTKFVHMQMKEVLQKDYIKMARAKGLPFSSWFFRHALPNAVLPTLSYLGQLLASVLVGSFVIEKIFSIPGLGQWFIHSVNNRDYPFIMALTLFYSAILMLAIFAADLLQGFLDPRIRLIQREK